MGTARRNSRARASSYRVLPGERCLVRADVGNVHLHVEPKLSVTQAHRGDYPDQVLFLDGVFLGAPFVDNRRRHYSLDHHQGCVRAFTLATCEQAAVVVAQGLPLHEGVWHVYAGEPDLDALLASWVLINHDRLGADDCRRLRQVMPLLRTEGVIDAHGFDMDMVSGLSRRAFAGHKARLEALRAREVDLRTTGAWNDHDLLDYVHGQLDTLDRQLDPARPAAPGPDDTHVLSVPVCKRVVLACSKDGIYEVEAKLKRRFDRSLSVIVLDSGNGRVTLLQVDPFLPMILTELYPVLDLRDPNADPDAGNGWGGSSDIGGAPRKTGTALSGREILDIVAELYGAEAASTSISSAAL